MLNPRAFANALAATSVLFYLVLWLLGAVMPDLFRLVFNAQFLGADVASLYSGGQDLTAALVTLVVVGVTVWVTGWVWASLYNYFTRS